MGIEIARNTVCGWIMASAEVCMPMRSALMRELIASGYIQADETPLQVIDEPNRKNTSLSYMWLYRSAIPDTPVVLCDYRETRQAIWPKDIIRDFKGHLQTDGYKGYDWVDRESDIIHLGCMAHARLPFAELVKLSKKTVGKSHQAVAYFQKLYAIEKTARECKFTHEQRYQLRMEKAKPIIDEMKRWFDQSLQHAVPQTKLKEALVYMHCQSAP